MQPKISAAAFIRDRKTIAADPEFASSYNRKADASGPDDDDAAVASAMRADTGDGCVMNVDNRAKSMRPLFELLQQALAADAGEPDCGMHGYKRVGAQAGILGGGATGFFDFGKGTIHAYTQRRRTCDPAPKQRTIATLDPRPAAGAAAVDADEERCGFGGRCHSVTRRMSAPHCVSLRSRDS